jgi:hypothetical protein
MIKVNSRCVLVSEVTVENTPLRSNFDFFRLIPHPHVCQWSIVGAGGGPKNQPQGGPGEGGATLRGSVS